MAKANYSCGRVGQPYFVSPKNDGIARFYGAELAMEDIPNPNGAESAFNAYYKRTPGWLPNGTPTYIPSGARRRVPVNYLPIDESGNFVENSYGSIGGPNAIIYDASSGVFSLRRLDIGGPGGETYYEFTSQPTPLIPANSSDYSRYWRVVTGWGNYIGFWRPQAFGRDISGVKPINPANTGPVIIPSKCEPSLTLFSKKQLLFTYNSNANSVNDLSKKMRFSYIVRNSLSASISRKTRNNLTFCAYRNNIYLFGGGTNEGGKDVEYFIFQTNKGITKWKEGPKMNLPRRWSACEFYNKKVFAIGGVSFPGGRVDSVEVLNVNSLDFTWKLQENSLPLGIADMASTQINYNQDNSIIVVGGVDNFARLQETPVVYNESKLNSNWIYTDITYKLVSVNPTLVPYPPNSPLPPSRTTDYNRLSVNTAYYQIRELQLIPGWRGNQPTLNWSNYDHGPQAGNNACKFREILDPWSGVINGTFPTNPLPLTSSFNYVGRRKSHSLTNFRKKTLLIGGHDQIDGSFSLQFMYASIYSLEDVPFDLSGGITTRWKYYTCLPLPRAAHTSVSYLYRGTECLFIIGGVEGSTFVGGLKGTLFSPSPTKPGSPYNYQTLYNKGHVDYSGNPIWQYYDISSTPLDSDGVITWPNEDFRAPYEVIYFNGNTWKELPGKMNYQRIQPTAVIFTERIYVVGGRDPRTFEYIDTPEYYEVENETWVLDPVTLFNHRDDPGVIVAREVNIVRE